MGGTQPDSTEIKSGLLPRFPGRRACEVNLRLSCFVVWLVVVRTGVWTAQAIGHLHHAVDYDTCAGERRIQFSLQAFCISRTSIDSSERGETA